MRAAALGLALGALLRAAPALTAAAPGDPPARLPLRCANESAQLFPVEIEALDAGGSILYSSEAGGRADCRKLCHSYPRAAESSDGQLPTAWASLTDVATLQFVLPAAMAPSVRGIRLSSPAQGALNQTRGFHAYHQDAELVSEVRSASAGAAVSIPYPPQRAEPGDPVQLTAFVTGSDGAPEADRLMGVFISFAEPEPESCAGYDHCCRISSDIAHGDGGSGSCQIAAPGWHCYSESGEPWSAGQPVGYVNYEAGLAHSPMASGGRSLLVRESSALLTLGASS